MFLFNQLFQFHSHVLFKVVLKECILQLQGGVGWGGGKGTSLTSLTQVMLEWCQETERQHLQN